MKSNNLFTYVLYGLLVLLIAVAGYKACEMRQKKAKEEQEAAELQKTLQDLGYTSDDATDTGSMYSGDSTKSISPSRPKTSISKDGIVDEENTVATPTTTKPGAKAAVKPGAKSADDSPTTTTAKSGTTSAKTAPKVAAKKPTFSSGRYMVVTGSFRQMANARDEMETLVKMGYTNAEVRKFNGAYATVIATRSNNMETARNAANKLRELGFPGAYVKEK